MSLGSRDDDCDWMSVRDTWDKECKRLEAENKKLRAVQTAAKGLLGEHMHDCERASIFRAPGSACNCGMDDLKAALAAAEAP